MGQRECLTNAGARDSRIDSIREDFNSIARGARRVRQENGRRALNKRMKRKIDVMAVIRQRQILPSATFQKRRFARYFCVDLLLPMH